jgi:ATP-dependent RNA helicase DDX21
MDRKNFDFSVLRYAVLDEADRMLNLGFKEEVEEIMRTIKENGPPNIQCLMFSATVPRWVQNIATCFLKQGF